MMLIFYKVLYAIALDHLIVSVASVVTSAQKLKVPCTIYVRNAFFFSLLTDSGKYFTNFDDFPQRRCCTGKEKSTNLIEKKV